MKPHIPAILVSCLIAGPISIPANAADAGARADKDAGETERIGTREIVIERGGIKVVVTVSGRYSVNPPGEVASTAVPSGVSCLGSRRFSPRVGHLDLDDFGSWRRLGLCLKADTDRPGGKVAIRIAPTQENESGRVDAAPQAAIDMEGPDKGSASRRSAGPK